VVVVVEEVLYEGMVERDYIILLIILVRIRADLGVGVLTLLNKGTLVVRRLEVCVC